MKSRLRFFLPAALGAAIGFALIFLGEPNAGVAMLGFDHSKHQAVSCQICHRGAMTQIKAGVPSSDICAKCHAVSPDDTPLGLDLWRKVEKKQQLRWPVSFQLQRHVYFSHNRHVAIAKLECETCHEDMSAQTVVVTAPTRTLNMDACVNCHQSKKVTDDCAQCHR